MTWQSFFSGASSIFRSIIVFILNVLLFLFNVMFAVVKFAFLIMMFMLTFGKLGAGTMDLGGKR